MPDIIQQYAYFVGTLVLAAIFGAIYMRRKDLRKIMIYSGSAYVVLLTFGYIFLFYLSATHNSPRSITPGYWAPPTLFDLGRKTSGYSLEDLFFIFFNGGIAAALYELVFNMKVQKRSDKRLKKNYALWAALAAGFLVFKFTSLNAIYVLVAVQLFGALALIWQRRDLIIHSLAGGLLFMIFYGCLFLIFNLLFPAFLDNYYHLERTSGIWFLGIPIEEFEYAISFGMLWAPLYEYEFKLTDSKRKSLKLRRLALVAGATRR